MPSNKPIGNSDWKRIKIDEALEVLNGLWIGKTDSRVLCKVLRNTNFRNCGRLDLSDIAILEVDQKSLVNKELKYGDILIEKSGGSDKQPVGRVVYFDIHDSGYSFSNFTSLLRTKGEDNSKYIFYVLYNLWLTGETCSLQRQTTGIRNLDFLAYKNLNLELPSGHEQEKIVNVLSTVDEEINQTDAIISLTEKLKHGLMRELFTKGIGHTKFKETDIGQIPVEWNAVLLDSVTQRGSGHTPNKKHPEYWNGGIDWVSLSDSNKLDNRYISKTAKEISREGILHSSAVLHPKDTVILCRDAAIGRVGILGKDDMAVSQHFITWQCHKNINNIYLYYLLQSRRAGFEQIAVGTTIKTIGLPYFKKLLIPLPPLAEQMKIADCLWIMDSKLDFEKRNKEELTRLKRGLMSDLLSGRVRIRE